MTLGWLFGALCAACCLATTLGQFSCNAFANSTKSQEFVTTGGTVPAGTPCCFPFVYRGQVYYDCTARDNPQAWCAVESVYQEGNKLWGNCQRIATPAPTTSTTQSTASSAGGATGVTGPATGGVCYSSGVANTNALGGTSNPATTVNACQAACSSDTNCVGLDFDGNTNPGSCYLHTDSNAFGNKRTANGVTQYAKTPCSSTQSAVTPTTGSQGTPGSCTTTYSMAANTISYGGITIPAPNDTPLECQAYCTNEPNCVGFDIDTNPNPDVCYWHRASTFGNRGSGITASQGINQYTKVEQCNTTTTQTTLTTSGACADSYTTVPNTGSFQGQLLGSGISDAQECINLCNSRPFAACQAFDYDTTQRSCYFHTNNFLSRLNTPAPGLTQYRRSDTCSGGGPGAQTSTSATGPGGCQDTFTAANSTFSYDGTQQAASVNTVDACATACRAVELCNAFDFNSENQCFLHTNPNYQANSGTGPGVTQFTRNRICGGSTTGSTGGQSTATTTASTTTGGTTVNTPCPIIYETVSNTLYYDGVAQQGISTENGCRERCTGSRLCVGFDFNYNSNMCYIHTSGTYIQANRAPFNGINTFRKLPCDSTSASTSRDPSGCVDSFRVFRNALAYDGVVANNVNSARDCERTCLQNGNCVAFDFDNNENMCYIHTNINDLAVRNNQAQGVDLYIRVPCSVSTTTTQSSGGGGGGAGGSTPCQDNFTVIPRAQALGGTEVTGASTVEACRTACLANSSCVAFDFNLRNMCYLHFGPNSIRSDNVVLGVDGVTHYRRVFTCGGGIPTTPPRIPGTCVDTFTPEAGTFYYGGVRTDINPLNVANCRSVCLRNSSCVGFDLDPAAGCFIHLDAANFVAKGSDSTITHYRRVPCNGTGSGGSQTSAAPGPGAATPTTASAGGCVTTYTPVPNTLSFGGLGVVAAQTVPACQEVCTGNSSCVEFDFDTNQEANIRCFIHVSQRPRQQTMGVTKYTKQQVGCGTTAAGGGGGVTAEPGCVMETRAMQNGAGGVLVSASTQNQCRDLCLSDRTCVAADFNTQSNQCFRHSVIAGVTTNAVCCVRFVKTCAACQDRYERRPEQKIVGGTEQEASINRESMCARRCSSQSTCTGFDFDRSIEKCFLFLRPISDSELTAARGVDNYVLRKCSDAASTTTARATTTRQTPTPTTECQDTFTITRNQQVLGGQEQPNTMSVLACEGLCRANQQCEGYDFNRASGICYLLSFDYQNNFVANREVDNYRRQRCDGTGAPTPAPGACEADILFLVDSSGSIQDTGQNNYQLVKDFVGMVTDRLDIGPNKVRVALAIFSTTATLQWDYSRYSSKQQIRTAINAIPYIGGETFTSLAFKTYLDSLRSGNGGNRPDVRDVIILITDGNTTSVDRNSLASTLTTVKNEAIVTGVGIGSIDINEMMMIVTSPFTQNYVNVQDFNQLINVLDNVILGTGCSGGGSPPPGPPQDKCSADLVIVIDESGSIRDSNVAGRPDNYDLLKNFAIAVVDGLKANIDAGNIRVGVIRFSDNARVAFRLDEYSSADVITRQITGLPFTGGNTNTTGALRTARTLILNTIGDRNDGEFPDRILLITDGYATREQAILEAEASTIKSQGTIIMGVGVTRRINVRNLERITSGGSNIFTAADFMQLNSIASDVVDTICPS